MTSIFNKKMVVGVGVVVASLTLAACSRRVEPAQEASTAPAVTETTETRTLEATTTPVASTAPGAADTMSDEQVAGEVRVINVEGGAFYYKPNEIRVKKGEKVKIVMSSKDMMHDFVIDELKVKMPVTKGGETGTVEFVADKAGTYEFYCSVGQHRAQGQVGKLIVE
jgi:nitrosocyanin